MRGRASRELACGLDRGSIPAPLQGAYRIGYACTCGLALDHRLLAGTLSGCEDRTLSTDY